MNKLWIWGGAGAAALAVGFFLLRGNAASSGSDTSGAQYIPPTVYSAGGGSVDPGGLNSSSSYSTDGSIAALISANLATATLQANTTLAGINATKDTALATLASQEKVALDDNRTSIEQVLANQVGNVVKSFTTISGSTATGPGSVVGKLGFDPTGNAITISVGQGEKVGTPTGPTINQLLQGAA